MNQQQPNQATPYKTEPKKPVTTYKVLENGDVEINQIVETVSFWHAREFISLKRQNEKALEDTKYNYSEEFIEKMKKQESEIVAEIEIMNPIVEEAEIKAKADYMKQRHEGLKASLISAINDKELNETWWQNVWIRTKTEIREPIFKELTAQQQIKYLKILQKLKRKNIQ